MVTFKRNNKMGVIGKRFIVVVNYVKTIQINIFPSVVEDSGRQWKTDIVRDG